MSAKKDYLSLPLGEFLADVAARSPTPGGGSVAASVGALAASLGRMVVEYTVGKPRFAEHEPRLQSALVQLKQACELFAKLMADDMRAYEDLVAARKGSAEAQAAAGARATAVPLEIVALAAASAGVLSEIGPMTNPHLAGDLRAAVILACAAAEAAACTVRDNLPAILDAAEASRLGDALSGYLATVARCREQLG